MENIKGFKDFISEGTLPQETTVTQLKKVKAKMNKEIGGDIGDKVTDMNKEGANIHYIQNPIDSGIESFQDYTSKNNKK